mgnify:CR=1 FL=1
MINVGDNVYVIGHVYYHFLGEVVEITTRSVTLKNCWLVHSCKRGWREFFRDGCEDDTTCFRWPDGTILPFGGMPVAPWKHPLPKE